MKKQKLTANGMTEQEEKMILLLGEMAMKEYREGKSMAFESVKEMNRYFRRLRNEN